MSCLFCCFSFHQRNMALNLWPISLCSSLPGTVLRYTTINLDDTLLLGQRLVSDGKTNHWGSCSRPRALALNPIRSEAQGEGNYPTRLSFLSPTEPSREELNTLHFQSPDKLIFDKFSLLIYLSDLKQWLSSYFSKNMLRIIRK